MSTYRGSDGEVTIGGTKVGEIQGWTLDLQRAQIETTAQGDSAESFTLEIPGARGSFDCNLDYGDAQQKSLLDMLTSGTKPTPLAAVFVADDGKTFTANILPTTGSLRSQVKGGNATVSFPFVVTGGVTIAWA